MRHLMLDLETLGTAPGHAILSIGAVVFDFTTPPTSWPTFYARISRDSNVNAGLLVDAATMEWWGKQSEAARREAFGGTENLRDALMEFCDFYRASRAARHWAHGGNFDGPMLEAALRATDLTAPWEYNAGRCTRTLYELADVDPKAPEYEVGTHHHALHDAMSQALAAVDAMRILEREA